MTKCYYYCYYSSMEKWGSSNRVIYKFYELRITIYMQNAREL